MSQPTPPYTDSQEDIYTKSTQEDSTAPGSPEKQETLDDIGTDRNEPWAKLVPLSSGLPTIELVEDKVTLGRHWNNSYIFSDLRISKYHCEVKRVSSGAASCPVLLRDLSLNGTYISSGKSGGAPGKVGKGKYALLQNNDLLHLLPVDESETGGLSYLFKDLTLSRERRKEEIEEEIARMYDVKELIGTGSFSHVFIGVSKLTGERVAIKKINKKNVNYKEEMNIQREGNILKNIEHENVVGLKEIFEYPDYLYLVLELASGGELFDYIYTNGPIEESRACAYFYQILSGVNYLHQRGIIHRDLKPENILFTDCSYTSIKITDFGMARDIGSRASTLCGTPQYLAPEIVKQSQKAEADRKGYGKKVDSWSLGVILYKMLSGYLPFANSDSMELNMYQQITYGVYTFYPDEWSNISTHAQDLVKQLLTVQPSKRLSVSDALHHPWMINAEEYLQHLLKEKEGPGMEPDCKMVEQTEKRKDTGKAHCNRQISFMDMSPQSYSSSHHTTKIPTNFQHNSFMEQSSSSGSSTKLHSRKRKRTSSLLESNKSTKLSTSSIAKHQTSTTKKPTTKRRKQANQEEEKENQYNQKGKEKKESGTLIGDSPLKTQSKRRKRKGGKSILIKDSPKNLKSKKRILLSSKRRPKSLSSL